MRHALLFFALSLAACNGATRGDAPLDASAPTDGAARDSGSALDSGSAFDSGAALDSGAATDSGSTLDAATPTGDGGTCGGSLMQSPTCESCLESMCCTEMTTCNATPGCPDVFECLHACSGSGTCLMDCLTSATTGIGESSAVDGCLYMHCPPSCRAM